MLFAVQIYRQPFSWDYASINLYEKATPWNTQKKKGMNVKIYNYSLVFLDKAAALFGPLHLAS
jgi:hypothetical protein